MQRLCAAQNGLLLYLFLYLFDFNLIKEFFSVFKIWLKKHFELTKDISFRRYLKLVV